MKNNKELYHYGRKGMKWYQNIFSKDDVHEYDGMTGRRLSDREIFEKKMIDRGRQQINDLFDTKASVRRMMDFYNEQARNDVHDDYVSELATKLDALLSSHGL